MTNDSKIFRASSGSAFLPLYEGKMMWQFNHTLAAPRYWVDEKEGRRALLGKVADEGQQLNYQDYRLVHRRITGSTNERTLVATVLPPGCFCGDTAQPARTSFSKDVMLFVTAVMNSFTVDSQIRQRVTNHCDMHFMYGLTIPRLTESDPAFAPIVNAAARLICTTPEFDDLAREVGLGDPSRSFLAPSPVREGLAEGIAEAGASSPYSSLTGGSTRSEERVQGAGGFGATDPAERARLRAELDGRIAHLYGLTEDEFAHILRTFPLVGQPIKDAAMEAYRNLGPSPDDAELVSLIKRGESAELEFKSSVRWDMRENKKNKEMEQVIVKTVAAFLNSDGGTLLIGVADDGTPLGLAHDFQTLGEKNLDGYELFLTDLLLNAYGKDVSAFLRITFGQISGHDICKILIKPSPKPIWIDGKDGAGQKIEQLFIRTNNSSRPLNTREALEYAAHRWKQ